MLSRMTPKRCDCPDPRKPDCQCCQHQAAFGGWDRERLCGGGEACFLERVPGAAKVCWTLASESARLVPLGLAGAMVAFDAPTFQFLARDIYRISSWLLPEVYYLTRTAALEIENACKDGSTGVAFDEEDAEELLRLAGEVEKLEAELAGDAASGNRS